MNVTSAQNSSQIINEHVFTIKSMFYLLWPYETYIKTVDEVPPLIDKVCIYEMTHHATPNLDYIMCHLRHLNYFYGLF